MPKTLAQEDAFGRLKKKHRDASIVGYRGDDVLVTWTEPTALGIRTKHGVIPPHGRLTEVSGDDAA